MVDTLCAIVSVVLLCIVMALQPSRARCPSGWHVGTVLADGHFTCKRKLIGGVDDDPSGALTSVQPPGELESRIYCTGGTHPIFVYDRTARTVGCQR